MMFSVGVVVVGELQRMVGRSVRVEWEEVSGGDRCSAVGGLLRACRSRYEAARFEECAVHGQILLDICWEKLNTGYWKDVDVRWRELYSYASLFKALAMVFQQQQGDDGASATREEILEVCDMGLLMGAPVLDNILAKISTLVSNHEVGMGKSDESGDELKLQTTNQVKRQKRFTVPSIDCQNEIPCSSCPSIESFIKDYFLPCKPVVIEDAMSYWPSMNEHRWSLQYIKQVAGRRLVPVEMGSKYTDDSWTQKLITINEFIEDHIENDSGEIGYLAQHQLFDQVPELKDDISTPPYCCVGEKEFVDINAWFGPEGTVSPLHYDPKHNCLSQVVGSKYVRLYDCKYTQNLYPHESFLLHNTSQVDAENPDNTSYPNFAAAPYQECILGPGEILYIPAKWWHYVRSLEVSFSVSFWWE